MFDNLSDKLSKAVRNLRGVGRLTAENMKDSLREVRLALLEADVALPVVKSFIEQVQSKAEGQDVTKSLSPGQALIKIVHDELVLLMGEECESLDLKAKPPVVILMAGLQGSGKTTTVAKLAKLLQDQHKLKTMVVSADIYRPAAIEQLKTLANQIGSEFFPSDTSQKPIDIAKSAYKAAQTKQIDVLLLDTAGRMHIDNQMMDEIKQLHSAVQPHETLFVVDSMTGQDAANTAKAFHDALPLTGVILTKTDGDARGGAALSIRHITGKPIKFMGVGEKIDQIEPFYPDRIASRILGMGDVLSLVEEVERKVDKQKADKLVKKLKKGKGFTLVDYRDQIQQMTNMGGMASMLDKLPGMGNMAEMAKSKVNDKQFTQVIAIIDSMTPQERQFPAVIKGSRKRRIAGGSGTQIQDVNRVLKQFTQMQKMMKKMSKGGMKKMMRGMQGIPGMGGMMPPEDMM